MVRSRTSESTADTGGVGCVIMASGQGKRFGSNKLLADFLGEPMILRALQVSQGLFFRRVVVTRQEAVARLCREQQTEVIVHDLPLRSDTVRLGLEALGNVQGCVFLPGDQPLLQPDTLVRLIAAHRMDPERILRPVCRGRAGAPVLFPQWSFPLLKNLPAGKGGSYVMACYPDRVTEVEIPDDHQLMDADTPEMLKKLEQLAAQRL